MELSTLTKNEYFKGATPKKLLRIAIAVGASLLLLFLIWRVYSIYQLSVQKIYKESYVPYQIAPGRIADTTTFTTIELFFAEGNYNEVVKQSRGLLSVTDRERLLIGVAYLQKEEYLKAISWLKRLAEVRGTPYQQVAEYYLTLTHLQNEDYDRTIELMQSISGDGTHPYQNKFTEEMIRQVQLLKWK